MAEDNLSGKELKEAKEVVNSYLEILNRIINKSYSFNDIFNKFDENDVIALNRYSLHYSQLIGGLSEGEYKISKIEEICAYQLKDATGLTKALNTLTQYGDKSAKELAETVYNRFPALKPQSPQ